VSELMDTKSSSSRKRCQLNTEQYRTGTASNQNLFGMERVKHSTWRNAIHSSEVWICM